MTGAMWLEGNGYRFVLERHWPAETLGVFLVALSVPAQMTSVIESFVMAAQFLFLLAGPAYHAAPQWLVFGCLLEVARLTINPWTMSALATKTTSHTWRLPLALSAVC